MPLSRPLLACAVSLAAGVAIGHAFAARAVRADVPPALSGAAGMRVGLSVGPNGLGVGVTVFGGCRAVEDAAPAAPGTADGDQA